MQAQPVQINFAQGLDTNTDPKQVQIGRFESLVNSVFTEAGALSKRNGFDPLPPLPNGSTSTYITTLNDNITAIGNEVLALSEATETWPNKGNFVPIIPRVLPVGRAPVNQVQCDSVIAENGLLCTAFTELNNTTYVYKYSIQNSITGQFIVNPTLIPSGGGTIINAPRIFLLGSYFIIAFTNVISSVDHLQFIAISTSNPSSITTPADLAGSYVPASSLSWDGIVVGNDLYYGYNSTSGGQSIKINYLNSALIISSPVSFTASTDKGQIVSLCADTTALSPIIYCSFYDSGGSTGYVVAVDNALNKRMSATEIISSGTVYNITSTAQNGVVTIAYEVANVYGYDNNLVSNFINSVSVTLPATVTTGTVGSTATILRSVGLASKACLVDGLMYMIMEYGSELQCTYFLVDITGNIVSRFSYENGGANLIPGSGYLPLGLPQLQLIDSTLSVPYLYKDLIESQTISGLVESIGPAGASNIYSQTGINVIFLNLSSDTLNSVEIAGSLNISGGMLWSYDGQNIYEQGFHVFPDDIVLTLVSDPSTTGTALNGSMTVTLGSVSNIFVGMNVSDSTNPTYIPNGTIVTAVGASTITISQATTHAISGDTLGFTGNVAAQEYYYQIIYENTDANGNQIFSAPSVPVAITATSGHTSILVNVPYLRLTYKTGVKLIIYRWSTAQPEYHQVTSLTSPTLNSTTSDYLAYGDVLSDAQIDGNSLIYTSGGAVEDTAGPASIANALFDDRLWLIDAEDQNLLWYSKQVIENTPVEMSDLFTIYVAPSTGAQGSTGTLTCIFPMDDKLILFKKDAIYWINGTGPDNTGSNSQYSQPIFITSTVGCANQRSIVMTDAGLMFQSDKGIWLLPRGLGAPVYIGLPVRSYNSFTVNSAQTIPETTQVRFTLNNGIILMYDYFYGQWATFEGVYPVSSCIYNGFHTLLDEFGNVLQETPGSYVDNGSPTLLSFVTGPINIAGLMGFQRLHEFIMLASYISPHQLIIKVSYNYGPFVEQAIVTPKNYTGLYGSDQLYGQTSPYGGPPSLEEWRAQVQQQQCQSFQISIQEKFDPSFDTNAGAGFVMSALTAWVGIKSARRPIKAANTVGTR